MRVMLCARWLLAAHRSRPCAYPAATPSPDQTIRVPVLRPRFCGGRRQASLCPRRETPARLNYGAWWQCVTACANASGPCEGERLPVNQIVHSDWNRPRVELFRSNTVHLTTEEFQDRIWSGMSRSFLSPARVVAAGCHHNSLDPSVAPHSTARRSSSRGRIQLCPEVDRHPYRTTGHALLGELEHRIDARALGSGPKILI